MRNLRELWFRPSYAGWNPHLYEWYFRRTPLGAAIRVREEEAVFDFLGTVMKPNHSVLEVGPGTGNYTVPLARRCRRIVSVDPSPEMLRYLRERLSREGLANVEARLGNLPTGPGIAEKFDGTLVIGVLNYAEDLEESLRALTSFLKPGGWAIFNVPLTTAEGRIYALTELVGRRRVNLLSSEDTLDLAERAGLRIRTATPTGLSRGGFTLTVGAVVTAVHC